MKRESGESPPLFREHPFLWGFSVILLPLVFGAFVITTSFDHGRWSRDLEYDDLSYYLQAYQVAESIRSDGVTGLFDALGNTSIRAPFSLAVATAAFLVMGYSDWGPLVLNLVVVLGAALIAFSFFPWRKAWQGTLAVIGVLLTPTLYVAVEQFRPDFAYGLILALSCALLFRMLAEERDEAWLGTGLAVGGAFLVKTSTFPLTVVMIGATMVLGLWASGWRPLQGQKAKALRRRKALWKSMAVSVAVCVPVYLSSGRSIFLYIWKVVFDPEESALWRIELDLSDRLMAYLNGPWAWHTALPHLWIWLGLVVAGTLVAILGPCERRQKWRMIHWVMMVVIAYGVVTYNGEKTAFLGLPFFCVSMIAALEASCLLLNCGRKAVPKAIITGTVLAAFLAGVFFFSPSRFVPDWHETGQGGAKQWKAENRRLIEIVSTSGQARRGLPSLYVATPALMEHAQIEWVSHLEKTRIDVHGIARLDSLESAIPLMKESDFVLACSQTSLRREPRFPVDFVADEIMKYLRGNGDFEEVAVLEPVAGFPYFLFRNRPPVRLGWGQGFYSAETDGEAIWRWGQETASLILENPWDEEVRKEMKMKVELLRPSVLRASWTEPDGVELTREWRGRGILSIDLGSITVGARESLDIAFSFEGTPLITEVDPRSLCFRVVGLEIDGVDILDPSPRRLVDIARSLGIE